VKQYEGAHPRFLFVNEGKGIED